VGWPLAKHLKVMDPAAVVVLCANTVTSGASVIETRWFYANNSIFYLQNSIRPKTILLNKSMYVNLVHYNLHMDMPVTVILQ